MAEPAALESLCEAVLAIAGEPVTAVAIATAAGEGTSVQEVTVALQALQQRYAAPASGLIVERVAGGWRMATRPELESALRAFVGYRARSRLSRAALETLAIVAYRQPVTLPEINFLRGVSSAGVVRTLLDRKLVRVAGRKAVVGTPLLYRTTAEFLVHFGIDDLSALPAPAEVEAPTEEGSVGP